MSTQVNGTDIKITEHIPVNTFTINPAKKYKGHTKITLTDVNTGEQEIHEEENLVTNAVSNIFSDNYSLTLDTAKLLPTYKMFDGVLCFQNTLDSATTNTAPPNEDDNHLIAHAGDEAHVTASTLRGNPNGGETTVGSNSVKFVWDWSTNQGNGTINCVCLTSSLCGNAGLKPIDASYYSGLNSVSLAKINSSSTGSYTREAAIEHPLIYVDETTGRSIYYTANGIEEITVKHDYLKFGLTRAVSDFVEQSSRSANTRPIGTTTAIFIDDDYYYVVTPYSATVLYVDKISREDMTVTAMDITVSNADFMTSAQLGSMGKFTLIPFEHNYLYWPNADNTTFYRISLTNTTDVVVLTSNVSEVVLPGVTMADGWQTRTKCTLVVGPHIIVGANYLINGSTIYPSKGMDRSTGTTEDTYPPYVYAYGRGTNTRFQATFSAMSNRSCYSGTCFNAIYLATINNLSQPVTKSNNQMMKIEYTLTEV